MTEAEWSMATQRCDRVPVSSPRPSLLHVSGAIMHFEIVD